MQTASYVVIFLMLAIVILIVAYNWHVMDISNKNIFRGSGNPVKMAETVVSSIYATSQFIFGIIIVAILVVLIIQKVITSDAGMPIISAIVGYLLGRTVKGENTVNRSQEINQ